MSVGSQCDFCKAFFERGTAKLTWTDGNRMFQFDVCDECAESGISLKRVNLKGKFLEPKRRVLSFGSMDKEASKEAECRA